MIMGRLWLNPKLAMLVTNHFSKLFKIDGAFKKNLDGYLKQNRIRLVSREYFKIGYG